MDREFQEAYRDAYDMILPDENSIEKIMLRAGEGRRKKEKAKTNRQIQRKMVRPAVAVVFILCILSMLSVPVFAAHVPAIYRMLDKYVPDLADYIVPDRQECADQGIVMRVEGVQMEGNRAQIIVSFGNQEGYHYIKGKVDLYDSYTLVSYAGKGNIGGCSFLTYDASEEKAYYKIDMTADQDFDREKLSFRVRELLTVLGQETKDIDISEILRDAKIKKVELRGEGGEIGWSERFMDEDEPLPRCRVLDGVPAEECAADDFTLTGVAYMDGILRIQMCMGDNTYADRHVQLFLVDALGNERHNDGALSWFENVGETRYAFYEYGFLVEEDALEDIRMYGIFHRAQESVRGDWQVTFRLVN